MSWLKKLFESPSPVHPDGAAPANGQVRMTLEERMAFRRKMVQDAVRTVLLDHVMASPGYRMNVAQLDERGHRFAIMLEWLPMAASRPIASIGEWRSLEEQIIQTAAKRYRVHVAGVYWRLNSLSTGLRDPNAPLHNQADAVDSVFATQLKADRLGASPVAEEGSSPMAPAQPGTGTLEGLRKVVRLGKKSDADDDFPDTLVEDRRQGFEGITPEELKAFEEAISQGRGMEQPVQIGKRSYQTDFMPLD